jgi:hypothetical protein
MKETILTSVRNANGRLRALLNDAEEAIAGRRNFTVDDLRSAQEPVSKMTPLIDEAKRIRNTDPNISNELQDYAKNLEAAQVALDRVRVVLLARCASMGAQRSHLESVRMWSSAWAHTQANQNASESSLPVESTTYERSSSGF